MDGIKTGRKEIGQMARMWRDKKRVDVDESEGAVKNKAIERSNIH